MWSTQWTMLRSIAGLLARLEPSADAAVLRRRGRADRRPATASSATTRSRSPELDARLRRELGDAAYEAALGDGAGLDGDAAVEHALRAL